MTGAAEVAHDDPRWLRLWNAVVPGHALTAEEARAWHAGLRGVWLLDADGRAGGRVAQGDGLADGVAFAAALVLPEARRQGRGSRILADLRARAPALGLRELRAAVYLDGDGPDGGEHLGWALRRGFEERGRETLLALDLRGAAAPALDLPPGLELVTWAERPDLAPALHAIAREAIPDIPGEEDAVVGELDEWLRDHMSGPSDRPEAVLIALAGGEAVGYAKLHLPGARPRVAMHDLTAVRRAWRGRGVARVLKRAQIAWAIERGYERLETANEERNAPIRALNQRFGYRPAATLVRLQGPVAT